MMFERLLENTNIIHEMETTNYNFRMSLMGIEHKSVIHNESVEILHEGAKETLQKFLKRVREIIIKIKNFIVNNIKKLIDFIMRRNKEDKVIASQVDPNASIKISGDVLGSTKLLLTNASNEVKQSREVARMLALPTPDMSKVKEKAENVKQNKSKESSNSSSEQTINGRSLSEVLRFKEYLLSLIKDTQNNVLTYTKMLEHLEQRGKELVNKVNSESDSELRNKLMSEIASLQAKFQEATSMLSAENKRLNDLASKEKQLSSIIHQFKSKSNKSDDVKEESLIFDEDLDLGLDFLFLT
jgi:vacuolar-type H+-ATPase subunit F/Vma7